MCTKQEQIKASILLELLDVFIALNGV
jgi:hypothetical protein